MISSIFFQEVPMKRQILMFAAALSLSASCLCTGEVFADYETSLSRTASSRQLAEQETMGFCGCALPQSTGLSAIRPIIRLFLLWTGP